MTKRKFWSITGLIVACAIAIFVYVKYYFVFGEGVKAGELNFVVYKGYLFKTYEGKAIQAGFNAKNKTTSIQSYEFEFSIADKQIADSLTTKSISVHCLGEANSASWWTASLRCADDSAKSGKRKSRTESNPARLYCIDHTLHYMPNAKQLMLSYTALINPSSNMPAVQRASPARVYPSLRNVAMGLSLLLIYMALTTFR